MSVGYSADKYLAFAVKTRSWQRIEAFVTLSKPELLIPGEKLNADPVLLNTPGRDGQLEDRQSDAAQRFGVLHSHHSGFTQ